MYTIQTPDGSALVGKLANEFSQVTLRRHKIPLDAVYKYPEYASPGCGGKAAILDSKGNVLAEFDMIRHRIVPNTRF